MKVITWNLGYWQHRAFHNEAWSYLRTEIKPDLALLQEVKLPKSQKNEHFLFKSIHGSWGTAIYTRKLPLEEQLFDLHPGRVVVATLRTENQRIVAISVHAPIIEGHVFPHLDQIFDEIENTVKGQTFIIGGDLNTARLAEQVWPGHGHGPFFERLKDSMFFDCCQKFHDTEQQTFFRNGGKHPFQDDHLFVSHNLADKVKSCNVLNNEYTRKVSDHVPLITEIIV